MAYESGSHEERGQAHSFSDKYFSSKNVSVSFIRVSHSRTRTPSRLLDRSAAAHSMAMSSEAAEPPKPLERAKSVNFGVPEQDGEECDVPRSTTLSSSVRSKLSLTVKKQRGFSAGTFGDAGSEWQT
eukprot:gene26421-17520_t